MNNLTLKEIIDVTKGKLIIGDEHTICEDFCIDTNKLQKGEIFVGIKGEKRDGGEFYKNAFDNGALGCIINENINETLFIEKEVSDNKVLYNNKFIVSVEDTIVALQEMAKFKREKYDIPVVAITGSVGKTSTKDMIASVLSEKYNVLKTEGNLNNSIGAPLTILRLKDHNAMVVEMGMSHLGEISVLTNIAKPTTAVITNVGTAHIGNLGSRENILKAKLEILEGLKEGGTVVINNDNDLLHEWYEENKDKMSIYSIGINNESEEMAKNINQVQQGISYQLCSKEVKGSTETINVPIGGEAFVYNSLVAIAVGKLLDIDIEKIKDGIEKIQLTNKRLDIKKSSKGYTIIDDTYNANYDSMKAAIEYLGSCEGKRKIAVLGDMKELGDFSKELHENVGKLLKKENIDLVVTVGELAKYIAQNSNIENIVLNNNEEAVEKLKNILQEGDIVLLKASNSMKFFDIVEKIL